MHAWGSDQDQLPCVRNGRLNKGQGVIEGVTSIFRCIIMPTKGGPSPPGRWGALKLHMQLTSRLNRACVCACLGAHTSCVHRHHVHTTQKTGQRENREARAFQQRWLPTRRLRCAVKYVRSDCLLRSAWRLGRGQSPLSSHSCVHGVHATTCAGGAQNATQRACCARTIRSYP